MSVTLHLVNIPYTKRPPLVQMAYTIAHGKGRILPVLTSLKSLSVTMSKLTL
jgi:hypothetical protein